MQRAVAMVLALTLVGGVSAAAGTASAAAAHPEAKTLRIGYVDLTRVLKEYQKREVLEADLKAFQRTLAEEDRQRFEEIQKYQKEAEQLAADAPARRDLERKHHSASQSLEQFRQNSIRTLNEKFVRMINELYDDLMAAVEAIGKEEGYDLIIKTQSGEREARSRDDAVLQISQQVVLYSRPEYDLTAAVVNRVNEKYAATRKEAGAVKPEAKKTTEGEGR